MEAAVDDIKMSYFLATIKTDVPMGDLTLDELKVEQPDTEKLDKIFTELEFKTLKNKFLNKTSEKKKNVNSEPDLFSAFADKGTEEPENANFESLKTIAHNYQLVETEEEAKKLCDYLLTNKIVSLDTETTSTHPIDAELVGLSFSVKKTKPFMWLYRQTLKKL